MWTILSNFLINMVIAIISDKVVVEAGKKLILKGVASATKGVGITDSDTRVLLGAITKSALNSYHK